MNLRVDSILVLPADRHLKLVPRCRQVQRSADPHERPRHCEREVSLRTRRLDLRLLAQAPCVEDPGEREPEGENEKAAACRGGEELHQKRK